MIQLELFEECQVNARAAAIREALAWMVDANRAQGDGVPAWQASKDGCTETVDRQAVTRWRERHSLARLNSVDDICDSGPGGESCCPAAEPARANDGDV